MPIPEGVDNLIVSISKDLVQEHRIGYALSILNNLLIDIETIRKFRGRVAIGFEGYDDDSREIYEIEEVRKYFQDLSKVFPYWFYFMNKRDDSLRILFLALCRYKKISPGHSYIHPGDYEQLLTWLFGSLNEFCDKYHLTEDENEAVTQEISDYIAKKKIGN